MIPSKEHRSLAQRLVSGAGWTLGSRLMIRLIGLVSIVILARLLTPADYGLVAVATAIAASVELLASFNFEVWLIRHPDAKEEHYHTVWTLSVIRGVLTGVVLAMAARPLSMVFDEPRLETVLYVLAAAAAITGLRNAGIVDFQKHLDFRRDFVFFAKAKLVAFFVTVGAAFVLRNYWALLAGIVTGHLAGVVLSFRMHPLRPRFEATHWREAFHFSKWLLASNLFGFAYQRSDTFVLGKLTNSETVGVYSVAHELANLTASELVMPLRRVLLPGYAKMAADRDRLANAFADGLALILLLGLPAAIGVGLLADPLVRTLLGERWLASIPLVQVLAIYGVAAVGIGNQGPVLMALGRTRMVSAITGVGVAMLIPAFVFATQKFGVVGGAWAASVVNVGVFFLSLRMTLKVVGLSPLALTARCWRAIVGSLVMAMVIVAAQDLLEGLGVAAAIRLVLCAAAGGLVYAAGVWLLWRKGGKGDGPEKLVIDFLIEKRFRQA